jgi:hypothetical protein
MSTIVGCVREYEMIFLFYYLTLKLKTMSANDRTLWIDNIIKSLSELINKYSDKIKDKRLEKRKKKINNGDWKGKEEILINKIVELLSIIEKDMSKDDQEDFDFYCDQVIELDCSNNLGEMTIYRGQPYIVSEIDFSDNEISVCLWDGDETSNGFYVNPSECKPSKGKCI